MNLKKQVYYKGYLICLSWSICLKGAETKRLT